MAMLPGLTLSDLSSNVPHEKMLTRKKKRFRQGRLTQADAMGFLEQCIRAEVPFPRN
jgi:hypothetical protein